MEITYFLTLILLLFTDCESMNGERITYCSSTLKALGNAVGSRPTISCSVFSTLQNLAISGIRPRGCRGGKKRNSIEHSTAMFTNKNTCDAADVLCSIPVITSDTRIPVQATRTPCNLIHVPLQKGLI